MGKDEASNDAKVPCLLRHTVLQLETTGGGLGDLDGDSIERSRLECLKDNRRITGLRDFTRRTNSEAKMQFIRDLDAIKSIQQEVNGPSTRRLNQRGWLKRMWKRI
jgi:hypothetical protein